MEDSESGYAATSSRGLGTDDATVVEVVVASSFVAAGDRLLVHT